MSESKTPRTDAAQKWLFSVDGQMQTICVHVEFAKALEQELERQYEENVHRIAEQAKAENERDQLKAEVERLGRQRNTGLETISRLAVERDQWLNDSLAPGLESPMLERYNKLKEGKPEENGHGLKLRTRPGA